MSGWINFQLSDKNSPGLHLFCFTTLGDWSRTLAPLFKPIRWKPQTNHDFIFRALVGSLIGLLWVLIARNGIFPSSEWLLWLLWCGFTTPNRKALSMGKTRRACYESSTLDLREKWFPCSPAHGHFLVVIDNAFKQGIILEVAGKTENRPKLCSWLIVSFRFKQSTLKAMFLDKKTKEVELIEPTSWLLTWEPNSSIVLSSTSMMFSRFLTRIKYQRWWR